MGTESDLDGAPTHGLEGKGHGREFGPQYRDDLVIVEGDEGHVIGDPEARLPETLIGPGRQGVI